MAKMTMRLTTVVLTMKANCHRSETTTFKWWQDSITRAVSDSAPVTVAVSICSDLGNIMRKPFRVGGYWSMKTEGKQDTVACTSRASNTANTDSATTGAQTAYEHKPVKAVFLERVGWSQQFKVLWVLAPKSL